MTHSLQTSNKLALLSIESVEFTLLCIVYIGAEAQFQCKWWWVLEMKVTLLRIHQPYSLFYSAQSNMYKTGGNMPWPYTYCKKKGDVILVCMFLWDNNSNMIVLLHVEPFWVENCWTCISALILWSFRGTCCYMLDLYFPTVTFT
jgi:hypothetical protein